ncbi:MAG: helix-turn-helix domain-containing protein [Gammaproteobacteria bacterium]
MKHGVAGFRGDRLAQILDARRLTQVQLSAMVGVSPATISKWRNEQQLPEHEALQRLASVVNIRAEWFLRPTRELDAGPVLARSNASALAGARALMRVRHGWSKELAYELGEYVDYPDIVLPTRDYTHPDQISNADIEEAAAECRRVWKLGLGPIPDVVLALENAGIIVAREITGVAQIEGLSSWCALNKRPFVYLSADKDNGFRSRFDAAHELGHLVLHRRIPPAVANTAYKELERQAHRFAGAFLLPAESFAAEVPSSPTLDTFLALKPRWKVSVGAQIMRMVALQLLDENEKLNLWKRRSARWGNKGEPHDDLFEPEVPRLLRRSVTLLVESAVMAREAIPAKVGLSDTDVERLACLPDDYFKPVASRVIDLQAVRLKNLR